MSLKTAAGDVLMAGVAGGDTPLGSLTVTSSGGGTVGLNDVSTVGGISVTTSGVTTLNGSAYKVTGNASTADLLTFSTALVLTKDTTITGGDEAADLVTFGSTVTNASKGLTIYATDLDIDNTLSLGGALDIYTRTGASSIGLGSGAGTLSLTYNELQRIAAATSISIGLSGTQTGTITATGAQLASGVTGLASVTISSDKDAGKVAFANGSGYSLDLNGNNVPLTVNAGSGGITSEGKDYACVTGTASTIKLANADTQASSFGADTTPITFGSGVGDVIVSYTGTNTSGSSISTASGT